MTERKESILKENPTYNIIPFIGKNDANKYKNEINSVNSIRVFLGVIGLILYLLVDSLFNKYAFIIIISLITIVIILFILIGKKEEVLYNELADKIKYFSIENNIVFLYENKELLGKYSLSEITVKPIKYLKDIYVYDINCSNLSLGNCYVNIEDSMNLKKSFILNPKKKS
ncbi:hypothetical protein KHQ81_07195 [Mycoplasmatota bacterium]|nr:hypothetical protein KHQ81_07195 [Mycoplasmatota bacterium]